MNVCLQVVVLYSEFNCWFDGDHLFVTSDWEENLCIGLPVDFSVGGSVHVTRKQRC